MTAHEPEVVGIDQPIRDLEAQWGISRNALKKRAAALGVELIRVSSTDTRWPAAYVDLGDQLHQHLQGGGTLKDFPGSRVALTASTTATSETKAITKGVDAEALAAVVATAMAAQLRPPTDPLVAARRLKEAADLGVWLSNVEMAETLGVADTTMRNYQDGHCPRPDFKLEKLKDGGGLIWWRVIHLAGTISALPATSRRVGFGGAIEASYETLNTVALPYFSY